MRTAARSAGYGALLVAAFAAAWTAGAHARSAPAAARRTGPRRGRPAPSPTRRAPTRSLLRRPLHRPAIFDSAPSRVAEVDGYQVRLDGDLAVGAPAQVFVTVSRDGAPVTDLEPLDDAFGRLVAHARRRPRARPRSP